MISGYDSVSIFTSIAVLLMGIKLAGDSAASIASSDSPVFSMSALAVLLMVHNLH